MICPRLSVGLSGRLTPCARGPHVPQMCEAAKKAEQEAKVVATKASSELAAKTAAKLKADQVGRRTLSHLCPPCVRLATRSRLRALF